MLLLTARMRIEGRVLIFRVQEVILKALAMLNYSFLDTKVVAIELSSSFRVSVL